MPAINASTLETGNLKGADHGATISLILDNSEPGTAHACTAAPTTKPGFPANHRLANRWPNRPASAPAAKRSSPPASSAQPVARTSSSAGSASTADRQPTRRPPGARNSRMCSSSGPSVRDGALGAGAPPRRPPDHQRRAPPPQPPRLDVWSDRDQADPPRFRARDNTCPRPPSHSPSRLASQCRDLAETRQ